MSSNQLSKEHCKGIIAACVEFIQLVKTTVYAVHETVKGGFILRDE